MANTDKPAPAGNPIETGPRRDSNRARWAILRSLCLFGGIALGIVLCFLTDLHPYLSISWIDFRAEQEALPRWKEPELKDVPIEQYIAARTAGKLQTVEGDEWKAFLLSLRAWKESGALPPAWRDRVVDSSYYHGAVYFRPDEPPLNAFLPQWKTDGGGFLFHPQVGYASVFYVSAPEGPSLMHSGSRMPRRFLYPYRNSGWLLMALSLVAGLALPWPPKAPGLINVSWVRILPHLVVGLLLGVFFLLPFLIVQGSVETLTEAFPLTIICWLFVIGCLLVIYITIKVEATSIALVPEGLVITSLIGGAETFRYADIAQIRGLLLRPPKWLTWGLRLSAPMAPTAGTQFTALGQAELLSASQGGGFRIVARDGRSRCIWFTDQMGSVIFRNFDQLLEALESHQLRISSQPELIRAFFPPDR